MRKIYSALCVVLLVFATLTFFGRRRVLAQDQPLTVMYSTIELRDQAYHRTEPLGRKASVLPNNGLMIAVVGTGAALTFSIVAGVVLRKKLLQF